jgi:hypothetical protein
MELDRQNRSLNRAPGLLRDQGGTFEAFLQFDRLLSKKASFCEL